MRAASAHPAPVKKPTQNQTPRRYGVMVVGMFLLSEVSTRSTQLEVTSSLILIGVGLGVTFPLYINAVQSAVDKKYLGVVTSNIQFFRNVGGTLATAIFGSNAEGSSRAPA